MDGGPRLYRLTVTLSGVKMAYARLRRCSASYEAVRAMRRGDMMVERTGEQIQREIEQARASLAVTIDQLATRTSPKRMTDQAKQAGLTQRQTPVSKDSDDGAGVLLVLLLARRISQRSSK